MHSCVYFSKPAHEKCLECPFYIPGHEKVFANPEDPEDFESEKIKEECVAPDDL